LERWSIRQDHPGLSTFGVINVRLAKASQEAFLDLAVEYWHLHGFPYYELTPQQIRRELQLLTQSDPKKDFPSKYADFIHYRASAR